MPFGYFAQKCYITSFSDTSSSFYLVGSENGIDVPDQCTMDSSVVDLSVSTSLEHTYPYWTNNYYTLQFDTFKFGNETSMAVTCDFELCLTDDCGDVASQLPCGSETISKFDFLANFANKVIFLVEIDAQIAFPLVIAFTTVLADHSSSAYQTLANQLEIPMKVVLHEVTEEVGGEYEIKSIIFTENIASRRRRTADNLTDANFDVNFKTTATMIRNRCEQSCASNVDPVDILDYAIRDRVNPALSEDLFPLAIGTPVTLALQGADLGNIYTVSTWVYVSLPLVLVHNENLLDIHGKFISYTNLLNKIGPPKNRVIIIVYMDI